MQRPPRRAGTPSTGRRRKRALKAAAPAKPARPLWSASQASALDGRTGKAGTASLVGVASERLGRPHRQSRHGLSGRRRKRAPWTAAPAKPARPLWSASQASALGARGAAREAQALPGDRVLVGVARAELLEGALHRLRIALLQRIAELRGRSHLVVCDLQPAVELPLKLLRGLERPELVVSFPDHRQRLVDRSGKLRLVAGVDPGHRPGHLLLVLRADRVRALDKLGAREPR